jgi:hypothetical protein
MPISISGPGSLADWSKNSVESVSTENKVGNAANTGPASQAAKPADDDAVASSPSLADKKAEVIFDASMMKAKLGAATDAASKTQSGE